MMNNNYTNFWNDIQVNTGVVDEDFVKPKVDHVALWIIVELLLTLSTS